MDREQGADAIIMLERLKWPSYRRLAWRWQSIPIYSVRYLVGIGSLSSQIMANRFATPFLFLHIARATIALLVGPLDLLSAVWRDAHAPPRGRHIFILGWVAS